MATELALPRIGLAAKRRILLGVADATATAFALEVASLRLAFMGASLAAPPLLVAYPVAALAAGRLRAAGTLASFRGVDSRGPAGTLSIVLIELAVLMFARELQITLPDPLLAAVLLLQVLLMVSWRRLEGTERWGWVLGAADGRRLGVGRLRIPGGVVRIAVGIGLLLLAIDLSTRSTVSIDSVRASVRVLVPLGLVGIGVAIVFLPPLLGVGTRMTAERRGRIRADERAKLAAHLHDSVLQTLTLIQRHGDEPTEMATLARRQERELREWLYGGVQGGDAGRLRDRIAALAAEIEDRYRWRVELIVVGDAGVDDRVESLIAAVREAMVNAARHSGATSCDVFVECGAAGISVFVRDRGIGFDIASIPEDRLGINQSLLDRMQRAGGTAAVRSEPGDGTEVELTLPRNGGVE